jgi:hypothetical protein
MHYKTNRLNHDFQIAYFLAGACHTPDAAYGLLSDLKEDRMNAIKMYEASKKKRQAQLLKIQRVLDNPNSDEYDRLLAESDLAEIEAFKETEIKNYEAALAEVAFINKCIDKVNPLRKFTHLPDAEAHEAAQREEWKLHLIHQAENHLLTSGVIPADHFTTMRMHPDFASEIMPKIGHTQELLHNAQQTGDHTALFGHLDSKKFDLPKLLK